MTHSQRRQWGRAQLDGHDDPYHAKDKSANSAVCRQCGVVCRGGRWQWRERPDDAVDQLCPACRRINDNCPAGLVQLSGAFLRGHRDELLGLIRHQESQERAEHPLNRIIAIEEEAERMLVSTTDIHLPRRIVEALLHAYDGVIAEDFDADSYFLRASWQRE